MRVAVVTEWREKVGGIETYLEDVVSVLADRHELAFWSANEHAGVHGAIALPSTVQLLTHGGGDPYAGLRRFAPDVIFAHGLNDPDLEARALEIAPTVALEHTYHGTCISGSKTMTLPAVRACGRRFGPACLALYLPRGCGGRSPVTMLRLYRTQTTRLATLRRSAAVVVFSEHLRDELRRHGLERVHVIPPFVLDAPPCPRVPAPDGVVRLLYLGRLEMLKGPACAVDAMPLVAERLNTRVELTIAGDGTELDALKARARACAHARVNVTFAGWLERDDRARLLAATDALVVPSLLPEPFGLAGLEAAVAGVPSVAFASGGIVDWLRDGETGCLAPADGDRAEGLARAIVRCVADGERREQLGLRARAAALTRTVDRHVDALCELFSAVSGRTPAAA